MDLKIKDLIKEGIAAGNIRLDITPEDIFKPRFAGDGDIEKQKAETNGFFFYIEITEKGPEMMLMKNYDFQSKTIAAITDAPIEHLNRAITDKNAKEMAGMFPIDAPLKDWIKEQLGL